jgi:hypothetical protein
MALRIVQYKSSDAAQWDEFCATNTNSTFLHTRQYLSYHQDRYIDHSLLIYAENKLIGLFPIGISKSINSVPMSHPGISYGGVIHSGKLLGELMIEAFDLSMDHLKNLGYKKFIYKPIPYIYNGFPAQDDLYALFVRGAKLTRCDLSSAINLANRRKIESKRINTQISNNLAYSLQFGFDAIDKFWFLLEQNLKEKYKTSPTHSLEEIIHLKELFPNNIELITISNSDECIGGLVLYWTQQVCHIQYMGTNSLGREKNAMDAIVDKVILMAIDRGIYLIDFGHSNENFGQNLNSGLYNFKSKFGGGGVGLLEFTIELG